MQQVLSVWLALEPRRRFIVILATLAMFVAIIGLSRLATAPTMTLLYAGLEQETAGEVVKSLEQRGVAYEIRGGSIFVDSKQRDELRMTLASEGLPANSSKGYELLDNLSGFGTTSQMFDAAYWRAKEGELARTIVSNSTVRSARVHISNQSTSPFARQAKPTASVLLSTAGGEVSAAQAKAVKFLVSSAVAGLSPEDVSIIDGRGALVGGDDVQNTGDTANRANDLRQSVARLLEARVGVGNAIVEVNVDTVTDRETIFERSFNPEGRVVISEETEERSTSSKDVGSSSVSVASNLPDGDAAGTGNESNATNSETRERTNYEVSETKREIQRGPGAIKRITVAVLLDGIRTVDPATGEETWSARSTEEIAALRELVASTVGLDDARGDSLTIKSMEFEPVFASGTEISNSFLGGMSLDIMSIIQLLVLAVVTLLLGMLVVKPILTAPTEIEGSGRAPGLPAPTSGPSLNRSGSRDSFSMPESMAGMPPALPALNGEIDDGNFGLPQMGMVNDFDYDDGHSESDDPVKRLKKLIEERQDESVEILRSWMETSKGTA